IGGILGILAVATVAASLLAHPAVNYVATTPGPSGPWVAFIGEAVIAFVLLMVVLTFSNTPRLARWTALFAGVCGAAFITFESPHSGMSMNPARTLGSAFLPHLWNSLWIYFSAPLIGMLLASEIYPLLKGRV